MDVASMFPVFTRSLASGLLAALALCALAGCEPNVKTSEISIDGSSTVFKLSLVAAEMYGELSPEVEVTVNYAGTGGGFKNFVKGNLDVCNASRPIQESEMAACNETGVEYYEIPIAFDALTVAVHKDNDWADSMTVEELKKLWQPAAEGKIMKWSDIRQGWPDERINLYGAGTDSGTFEYFTEAIVQKKNASRSDYTASENDNIIIQGLEGDKFALGYIPYAYYAPRQKIIKAVKIDAGEGPVAPTPETVMDGSYHPLSRPLFIYVNKKSAERPEVKAFVELFLNQGPEIATAVKYIPLPQSAYPVISDRFHQLHVGTAFGGHSDTAVKFEEVLKREPKL